MVRTSIVTLLFVLLFAGCEGDKPKIKTQSKEQVTLSSSNWEIVPEKSFGRNGETSMELLAYCTIVNRTNNPIVFDNLRASFYAGNARICGSTVYIDRGEVMMLYSNTSDFNPPNFDPTFSMTITVGGAYRVPIQSSNCNLASKRNRKVVIDLYNGNRKVVGPFQISVPDTTQKNVLINQNQQYYHDKPLVTKARNKKYSKPHLWENSIGCKIIPQVKNNGRSIDWVMVTNDFEGSFEPEQARVTYNGKRYLRVGLPNILIDNQKNWLLGNDEACGIVYSIVTKSIVNKIEDILAYPDQSSAISEFEGMVEINIKVDGHLALLYYDLEKDPVTDKFPWFLLDNIRYYSSTEIVPKGYRPLWSLKILHMKGFDFLDCSPRLTDKAIEKLIMLFQNYVYIRGVELTGKDNGLDALVLSPKSGLRTKEVRMVQFGNGSYQFFDRNSSRGELVRTLIDAPNVVVEPLNKKTWNFRKEYLVPYRR